MQTPPETQKNTHKTPKKYPWNTLEPPLNTHETNSNTPWPLAYNSLLFLTIKTVFLQIQQHLSILKLFGLTLTLTLTNCSGPRGAFAPKNTKSDLKTKTISESFVWKIFEKRNIGKKLIGSIFISSWIYSFSEVYSIKVLCTLILAHCAPPPLPHSTLMS